MGTQYTLRFKNNSTLPDVYQKNPGQDIHKNLFPLAWFSKVCNPKTTFTFKWTIDCSFVWSETGELVPGVFFDASEVKDADPANTNMNATGFIPIFLHLSRSGVSCLKTDYAPQFEKSHF